MVAIFYKYLTNFSSMFCKVTTYVKFYPSQVTTIIVLKDQNQIWMHIESKLICMIVNAPMIGIPYQFP